MGLGQAPHVGTGTASVSPPQPGEARGWAQPVPTASGAAQGPPLCWVCGNPGELGTGPGGDCPALGSLLLRTPRGWERQRWGPGGRRALQPGPAWLTLGNQTVAGLGAEVNSSSPFLRPPGSTARRGKGQRHSLQAAPRGWRWPRTGKRGAALPRPLRSQSGPCPSGSPGPGSGGFSFPKLLRSLPTFCISKNPSPFS